jgi:hypothetical protein
MSNSIDKTARLAELSAELDSTAVSEPAGVRRLREARESAAAREESASADAPDAPRLPQPGEWLHSLDESGVAILRSTSIFGSASVTLYRGDSIQVDAAMLEADLNRFNQPGGWSALLHNEPAQVARWGAVRIRAGRAPRDLQPWTHGSPLWSERREEARRAAWAQPNPEARAEALAEVHRVFGAAPSTSTITGTIRGDADAEAQGAAIAASAAAGVPNLVGGVSS